MTLPADTDPRPRTPLSIVSIEDYEALVAPREAFVDFLVGPYPARSRPEALGSALISA